MTLIINEQNNRPIDPQKPIAQSSSPLVPPQMEKEAREVSLLFAFAKELPKDFSEAVIRAVIQADQIKTCTGEKSRVQKQKGFYDALMKECKTELSAPKPAKNISATAALLEEIIRGDKKGPISKANKKVKKVFSYIGTAKDTVNLASLTGLVVHSALRKEVIHHVEAKIHVLKKAKESLPKESEEVREKIQKQIDVLTAFLTEEKKILRKEVVAEYKAATTKILDALEFGCDVASSVLGETPLATALELSGTIVGLLSGGLDLLKDVKEGVEYKKTFTQYNQWLTKLENRLDLSLSKDACEAVHQVAHEASLHFRNDKRILSPAVSPEERGKAMLELKKEMKSFIIDKLKEKNISGAEGRAELLAHVQIRKFCHEMKGAQRSEAFTATIKSGLTNLAIAKQRVEKSLTISSALFHVLDTIHSALDWTADILLLAGLLVAPVAPFVALGLLLAEVLLLAVSTAYNAAVRPNLFKESWSSADSWLSGIRKIQSKFLDFQLARAKEKVAYIEEKAAPISLKLALLEKENSEQTERATEIKALREKMEATGLSQWKARVTDLTARSKAVRTKIEAFEERLSQAREKDHLNLMRRSRGWKDLGPDALKGGAGLRSLVDGFENGIVDRLLKGEALSPSIAREIYDATGIQFDLEAIQKTVKAYKAAEKIKVRNQRFIAFGRDLRRTRSERPESIQAAVLQKESEQQTLRQKLLRTISKPIHGLLAREEGSLDAIPALA